VTNISIYQPNYLYPQNITIDNTTDIIFTAIMQGAYADGYMLVIYDMDNNIVFNSGALPLTTILYQDDLFSYILPALTLLNGKQYKQTLQLYSDSLPIQQCFSYNALTSTYTDETNVANDSTENNMNLVPISTVQDAYYFGSTNKFSGINLTIGTFGVYTATLVWEYYNSTTSAWISIPLLTDNTNGFTSNGMILFDAPSDWVTVAVNSSTKYWIRCRVSAFTSKTTSPLGTQAWSKTSAISKQTPFFAYTTPTLSMVVPAEITSRKHLFTATYSQIESISSNVWSMTFLNANDEIVLTTPNSYSGNISYTFDGFINNSTYKVYTTVINQQNVTVTSPIYTFNVVYASPSMITVPKATLLPDISATKVEWSPSSQIIGSITGVSEYISGLFISENTGLSLGAESYIEFQVDIPLEFTLTIDYIPDDTFTGGKMIRLENPDLTYFEIGYNSEIGCYYYDNNNFVLNGIPKEFIHAPLLIAIKGVEVLIISNNTIYEYLRPQ